MNEARTVLRNISMVICATYILQCLIKSEYPNPSFQSLSDTSTSLKTYRCISCKFTIITKSYNGTWEVETASLPVHQKFTPGFERVCVAHIQFSVFYHCCLSFGAVMTTVLPVLFKYCYKYCYSDSRKL